MFAAVGLITTPTNTLTIAAAGPFSSATEARAFAEEDHVARRWVVVEMYQPDADD